MSAHRFRDTAGYLSKVADFDLAHLHLATPQGVIPVEFRGDLWLQKTRFPALSCGVVCAILRLAVSVELRLVTGRQTRTGPWPVPRMHIASRGKNWDHSVICRTGSAVLRRRWVWRRGAVLSRARRMNKVNARRARLVLGWVTVFERVYRLSVC